MSESLSIGFYCSEYPPAKAGGIGSFTQSLSQSLVKLGHNVFVIGQYKISKDTFEIDNGVNILRLAQSSGRYGWVKDRVRVYSEAKRIIKSEKIQIFEAPDFEGPLAFWPSFGVPTITRLHGSLSYFAREMNLRPNPTMFFLEKHSLRRSAFICSVSIYTAQKTKALFGLEDKSIPVIYNGMNVDALASVVKDKNLIVFSGTLTEKKGVFSLAKAWPQISFRHPELRLEIYGRDTKLQNGESAQKKMSEIFGSSLTSVTFFDHVGRPEVLKALERAQIAIFPSYAEAFAIAPLEAMAKGCATIYSSRGSGPEVIGDGVDGILIDPDDIEAIVNSVSNLVTNTEYTRSLGERARKKVENDFSLEHLVSKNINHYRSCIRDFHKI